MSAMKSSVYAMFVVCVLASCSLIAEVAGNVVEHFPREQEAFTDMEDGNVNVFARELRAKLDGGFLSRYNAARAIAKQKEGNLDIPVVLISANVGSLFEQDCAHIPPWTEEVNKLISQEYPQFFAIHCQEMGGKSSSSCTLAIQQFIEGFYKSDIIKQYKSSFIFVDEDFFSTEHYTGLASFYFIKDDSQDISIYDFQKELFLPISGHHVFTEDLSKVSLKEKWKFELDAFPHRCWSRKGVLRTRWKIHRQVLDFVNVHLFHDTDNLLAMQRFPSEYGDCRRAALTGILDRLCKTQERAPFFIFGDFNFRLHMRQLIQEVSQTHNSTGEEEKNSDLSLKRIHFPCGSVGASAVVAFKEFRLPPPLDTIFMDQSHRWRELDGESQHFLDKGAFVEFPVKFPPSYPFSESLNEPTKYMGTRCPSWCDRIFMSPDAVHLIKNEDKINTEENKSKCKLSMKHGKYAILGMNTPMGDHKPVYLSTVLKCGNI